MDTFKARKAAKVSRLGRYNARPASEAQKMLDKVRQSRYTAKHETISKAQGWMQQGRTRCETIRARMQGRKVSQGKQATRKDGKHCKRCKRKETDTAQGRTHPSKGTKAARTAHGWHKPHGLRWQPWRTMADYGRLWHVWHERPRSGREGCHGGSGQRVGSEGVSHERTKFRCT